MSTLDTFGNRDTDINSLYDALSILKLMRFALVVWKQYACNLVFLERIKKLFSNRNGLKRRKEEEEASKQREKAKLYIIPNHIAQKDNSY